MPWTQADADAIRAAIVDGKGARSMTFGDQSVTFNSIDEMLKLIAVIEQSITTSQGGSRSRLAATSKGV